jgi:hypothetical protein
MKELEDYSEVELKALVYDEMGKIEIAQGNIKIINSELQRRASLPKEAPKEEVKKK